MTPLPQILVVAFVAWMAWTAIRTYPAAPERGRWAAVTVVMAVAALVELWLVGMLPGTRP